MKRREEDWRRIAEDRGKRREEDRQEKKIIRVVVSAIRSGNTLTI